MERISENLLKDLFSAAMESVRDSIRETLMYGCDPTWQEKVVLGKSPQCWTEDFRAKLRKQFLKECKQSELIIAGQDDLLDEFDDLMQGGG